MLKLSPYQIEGVEFLTSKLYALLADDMGLGKTPQTIVAAQDVGASAILVICPAVARVNWRREFKVWSNYKEFTVCEKYSDGPSMLSIVSYDFATENYEVLARFAWDLVICDESHFIKEPTAKRTQAIYGKNGIIRNSARLWALSGTPAPNHVGELWAMLYTFGATTATYERFIEKYCETRPTFYAGKRQQKVVGTKNSAIAEIKTLLSSVMLRRLKREVLVGLPPISFGQISVDGTPLLDTIKLDMSRVRAQENGLNFSIQAAESESDIEFILEKLGDSVSTLRRYVGLQKVKSVSDLVSMELKNGQYDKLVIFAIHTDVIGQLKENLKAFGPVVVNGKVSPKNRQKAIDDFQNKKSCKVFIGNILAAGTAITLTAAHQVLFVEQSWVPGENSQAADRCHRRGQDMPVSVRFASLADSIDEKVTSVLTRKARELTQIFDKGE